VDRKLLLINNGYPVLIAPNYTAYVKTIYECLKKAGFEVDLLVLKLRNIGRIAKIVQYLFYFIKLLIKPINYYTFIYINHAPFAIPIFFRHSLYNKKIIIHWHGEALVSNTNYIKFALLFLKSRIQNVQHIVPSLYLKKKLIEILGIHSDKIIVSPSGGVDVILFAPFGNKKKEKFVIGFASVLNKQKGSDLILDIMRRSSNIHEIINTHVEFNLIAYGSEKQEFIEKCNNERLPVLFYQKMDKEKMVNFYNTLDVLLMPSMRESLGLVALEAMSCNVPVIAYNICAFPEYIISGKTGMLVNISENNNENHCCPV
jgi:glycosyltransferase involved in cell wall biosynthesis